MLLYKCMYKKIAPFTGAIFDMLYKCINFLSLLSSFGCHQ